MQTDTAGPAINFAVVDPTPAPAVSASAPLYLTEPKPDLAAWLRFFTQVDLPVLTATARAIEDLRAIEDDVDAGMLSRVIDTDPLMTLKLLIDVSQRRRDEDRTETETVTSSLVMYGVAPFFRRFGPQPTLEDQLRDQPDALQGALALLDRSRRAAWRSSGAGFGVSDCKTTRRPPCVGLALAIVLLLVGAFAWWHESRAPAPPPWRISACAASPASSPSPSAPVPGCPGPPASPPRCLANATRWAE